MNNDSARLQRPPMPRQCQTVHDVISLYLPQAKREVAATSYEYMARYLEKFDQDYGQVAVQDLRPFDLQFWLNQQTTLRSEATIRRIISGIKRVFNWALDMELIQRNPVGRYRSRGRLTNRRSPMRDEHFQALLRCSPPIYRRFLIFLKFTGCRPGEAAIMKWSDVHFEKRCVILQDHKTAAKTGRPRIIPLVPPVIKLLAWMKARKQATVIGLVERLLRNGPVKGVEVARFLSHYGLSDRAGAIARKTLGVIRDHVGGRFGYYTYRLPDSYSPPPSPEDTDSVFLTCRNNPFNKHNLLCFMQRTRKRAGLPKGVILYQLRHRFFFMGVKNNVNLKLLSLAGGHSSTAMTEHYIMESGLSDDVLKAALQVAYGPGAYLIDAPPPPVGVPTIWPRPADQIAIATEQVPTRYGNPRRRPNIKADLADVPMPNPSLSDPGEQSVESMMKFYMVKTSGQRKARPHRPTSSKQELNPTHELVYQAFIWALERKPDFATARDQQVYEWLMAQADCRFKLPPTFPTFARYLSAARFFHDCLKRQLPLRRSTVAG